MERITYRKTLDVHKNGVQFILQGFDTADNMSRSIEVSLMANGDTIDFPSEKVVAMIYVTTPSAAEPSINECTIKDNKIIYDVLPIVEEGFTCMQLKIIGTSPGGATSVLATPKFAVEVSKSGTSDEEAERTTTFTALEDAVATAKGVYDERLLRVEITDTCIFKAHYADGTVYETDAIKECLLHGNAKLAKSYAVGDTGIREEEDSDNAKYYSGVSRSSSEEARLVGEEATTLLEETRKHGVYTSFMMDFDSGELLYISPSYNFTVNKETGDLDSIGTAYSAEEALRGMVSEASSEASGADYVIEEGSKTTDSTSNSLKTVWRYRRWSSGLAEAWGISEYRYGGDYKNTFSNDFSLLDLGGKRKYPFHFTKAPNEQVTLHSLNGSVGDSVFPINADYNSYDQSGTYKAAIINESGTYRSITIQLHIYVQGNYWKEAEA